MSYAEFKLKKVCLSGCWFALYEKDVKDISTGRAFAPKKSEYWGRRVVVVDDVDLGVEPVVYVYPRSTSRQRRTYDHIRHPKHEHKDSNPDCTLDADGAVLKILCSVDSDKLLSTIWSCIEPHDSPLKEKLEKKKFNFYKQGVKS